MGDDALLFNVNNDGLEVVLVLDYSGSMSGFPLVQLKAAANSFVDMMDFGDNIGVVWFNQEASLDYVLTELADVEIADQVKTVINEADAGGMTSIGAGLLLADDCLDAVWGQDKAIVLISDGMENTAPMVEDVIPEISCDINLYTIAIGQADPAQMAYLANDVGSGMGMSYDLTSASYSSSSIVWPNPEPQPGVSSLELQRVYRDLSIITGGETQELLENGTVANGEVDEYEFQVDAAFDGTELIWRIDWTSGDLDLELIAPDGSVYDHEAIAASSDIRLIEYGTYEIIRVSNIASGQWRVAVAGVDVFEETEYDLSISTAGNPSDIGVGFLNQDIEPDNNSTPTVLQFEDDKAKVCGSLGIGDGVDMFALIPEASGTYCISLDNLDAKTSVYVHGAYYDDKGILREDKLAFINSYQRVNPLHPSKYIVRNHIDNLFIDATKYIACYIDVAAKNRGKNSRSETNYNLIVEKSDLPEQTFDEFNFKSGHGDPALVGVADNEGLLSGSASGWVGQGDGQDVFMFDLAAAGEFNFALTGLNAKARINLYHQYEKNNKLRYDKIASGKFKDAMAVIDGILLDGGSYYIEVLSGDKGRGKFNTEYAIGIDGSFLNGVTDNNNWEDAVEVGTGRVDSYVGFCDPVDFYKFSVLTPDSYDLNLSGEGNNAVMAIYEWDAARDKYREVANSRLRRGEAIIAGLELDAGLYYVEIISADRGHGKKNTGYELNVSTADIG